MSLITKQFESSSGAGTYTATFDTDSGMAACDCKGFRFPRNGQARSCKHTKAIVGDGAPVVTVGGVKAAPVAIALDFGVAPAPVEAANGGEKVKPMLASAMKEDASVADFATGAWIMEEKFDGHRLLVRVIDGTVTAWSRPGASHDALRRVLPVGLASAAGQLPNGLYDGELCIPGGTSSDVTRLDRQADLRLILFDAVEVMGVSIAAQTYTDRRAALGLAVSHVTSDLVSIAATEPVSLAAVQAIWTRGGEGAILKRIDSTYRSGWRTPDWIKVKAVASATLAITGFKEGKNGPFAVAMLRDDAGRDTTVKVLDNDTLRAIAKDPSAFIGQRLVVSYMGRTTSGQMRHAMWDHVAGAGE